jgi:hypothetical protein
MADQKNKKVGSVNRSKDDFNVHYNKRSGHQYASTHG